MRSAPPGEQAQAAACDRPGNASGNIKGRFGRDLRAHRASAEMQAKSVRQGLELRFPGVDVLGGPVPSYIDFFCQW